MGKYVVICWTAVSLLLLQTDVTLAKKKPKPSGGGWNTGGQRPGYPQNPSYPHNPGYPQNPGYPHNPGYPPRNPGYPAQNPGYPGYPQRNPGYPGYGGGYGGGYYGGKPWKPKPPKPKMKHVAGAAVAGVAAGAVGGYLLGNAMSSMRFSFHNPMEEQWWYANRDRYSDQVYYRQYDQPVSRDVFVKDCVNITVKEYTEPTGNQTQDEMEQRVVTRVVHEMCTEQYRLMSGVTLLLANPIMLFMVTLITCFLIP